ncbi:hypothetical protein F5Y06DRAFT_279708 [Hypoxylon sp. FL0890]|nr:hypothetical protein F5Y06DRAFT_279708 [Hypoxylon sp. FL0890]
MDTLTSKDRPLKLARLFRSRSASNMLDVVGGALSVARNKYPSDYCVSPKNQSGVSIPSEDRRRSINSLRKKWITKTHAHSLSHLHEGILSRRTTVEHHDQEVAILPQNSHSSRFRALSSSSTFTDRAASYREWPERTSSGKDCVHLLATNISSRHLSRANRLDDIPMETQNSIGKGDSWSSSSAKTRLLRSTATMVAERTRGLNPGENTTSSQMTPMTGFGNVHQCSNIPRNQEQKPTKRSPSDLGGIHASHRSILVNTETVAQLALGPPEDPSLPESPGFPKMLAAMTFPSPPTTSRPPSQDRTSSPMTPCQGSMIDRPAIRPRSSSRPSCTANEALTFSIDKILMQPTAPILRHAESNDASAFSSTPGDLSVNKSKPWFSSSASSPVGIGYDSVASATSNTASSERRSISSNVTTITSSPQGSANSNEPDTPISTGVHTTDAIKVSSHCKETAHHCFTYPLPTPAKSCHGKDLVSADPASIAQGFRQILNNKAGTEKSATYLGGSGADGRKNIVERRIARREKVQAYKRRDLEAAKLALKTTGMEQGSHESKDSPVLGWFADNISHSRILSLRGRSQARMHQISTQNTSAVQRHCSPSGRGSITFIPTQSVPRTTAEEATTTSASAPPSCNWRLSRIMVVEIVPGQCTSTSIAPLPTNEITISPMIVTADMKPQIGSSMMSVPSVLPCATSRSPPRLALKHKLKIIPQQRPKSTSILMHRNPVTGDIKRIASTTNKSNRHSLASMPTVAPSPSTLSLRRRSHPAGICSLDQSPEVWSSSGQLDQLVWDATNQHEHDDGRLRTALIRERLQREKRAKEEEISELVERTIWASRVGKSNEEGEMQEYEWSHTSQQIENQLQRLEENGDNWLRVVKALLKNMSETLNDLRENNENKGLTMSEFTIDIKNEGERLSPCNHFTHIGKKKFNRKALSK